MHLVLAITPHGFGHAAQVAPVVNTLRRLLPTLRLTILTCLPERFLRERVAGPFDLIESAPDFGLKMNSALDIDLEASAFAYGEYHRNWASRVDDEARRLAALSPDLVLADVPYLLLAAAHRLGIPSVALCSLNWADIYRYYFSDRPEAAMVLGQMEDAYQSALAFICPEPSMPMPFLENRVSVGPIAARGKKRREFLLERLGIERDKAIVLVAPGGVHTQFPIESWPVSSTVHWLVSETWGVERGDVSRFEALGLTFTDLLASCDAVLGKCGYGTVTECVVNATPLLYIARPDWPEERSLLSWLQAHNAAIEVEATRIKTGQLETLTEQLRGRQLVACTADGAEQAAREILRHVS